MLKEVLEMYKGHEIKDEITNTSLWSYDKLGFSAGSSKFCGQSLDDERLNFAAYEYTKFAFQT